MSTKAVTKDGSLVCAADAAPLPEAPVIILNWNGWDYTLGCLRSLRAAHDVRIVWLVDNASDEDRFDEVTRMWPGVRVVRLDQNYGFAGGMNRALRIAAREGFEFAYLLNNDCAVTPGFLRNALEVARLHGVAVVGSRITYADESNSVIFDGEYHPPGHKPIAAPFETRRVSQANGAGMLVRLDAIEAVGYFDERFFCYHEEVDLCWRLADSGFAAVIAAGSLVSHFRAGSDVDENAVYYRTRNEFLLARHFRGLRKLKRLLFAVYGATVEGREAARRKDAVRWRALATGIDDGLHSRFGGRRNHDASRSTAMQFRLLCAIVPSFGRFFFRTPPPKFAKPNRRRTGAAYSL